MYDDRMTQTPVSLAAEHRDEVAEWQEEFGIRKRGAAIRDMIEHAARWRRGELSKRRAR